MLLVAPGPKQGKKTDGLIRLDHQLCDKCFRPSAKDLLNAKKKKRRGKKRKAEEFEEGSADEAERLMGWIECEKCTVSFHWVSTAVTVSLFEL